MKKYSLKPLVIACALSLGTSSLPALAGSAQDKYSDTWTKASLVTTYTLNSHLNPFDIDVDVKDGTATLRGEVENDIERDLAEEIALGMEGVNEVNNELKVVDNVASNTSDNKQSDKGGFFRVVEDANVTAKIKSQLLWNSNTSGLSINVDTKDGFVTLKGEVSSSAEYELAEQLALNTKDVRGVDNKLKIMESKESFASKSAREVKEAKKTISDSWITSKAKAALMYNRNIDASDINIDTKNGVVTLKGKVGDKAEKELVSSIVRDIEGVKKVELELESRS